VSVRSDGFDDGEADFDLIYDDSSSSSCVRLTSVPKRC